MQFDGHRHPLLQITVGIVRVYPEAVNEIGPSWVVSTVFGVNSATGEINPIFPV